MSAHKLLGSCRNKPFDSLNELRVFQRFIYLALQYFPLPAFRQRTDSNKLLHFIIRTIKQVYKTFAQKKRGWHIKAVRKKGRLYVKFFIAAALLITLVSALYTLAANPSAIPSNTRGMEVPNAPADCEVSGR